jgi:hypothetical protein
VSSHKNDGNSQPSFSVHKQFLGVGLGRRKAGGSKSGIKKTENTKRQKARLFPFLYVISIFRILFK